MTARRRLGRAPLWRKVNTRTHGVHHAPAAGDFRHDRNTKAERETEDAGVTRGKMRQGVRHGRDYTPLYRFLLSKVGQPWSEVHSEAVARLDEEAAIYRLVALDRRNGRCVVRVGESSFYSGLFVDEAGTLLRVEPGPRNADLWPTCPCCTHTFDGERLVNAYDPERASEIFRRLTREHNEGTVS
jgi:hypothetical protein